MHAAAGDSTSARSSGFLTLKLFTVVLLLVALGVMMLSVHSDAEPMAAMDNSSVADTQSNAPAAAGAAAIMTGADVSALSVAAMCVLVLACCVLLAVTAFGSRLARSRTILTTAPRGSPAGPAPSPVVFPGLSLPRLSISRT